jgi:hypothetical protein
VEKSDSEGHIVLEAWKQTIQVQQHFNDIELRIRNYAITLLGGLFGVIAFAVKEHVPRPFILGLLAGGWILCFAFYFLDRHVYHRLLVGAVNHGQAIEKGAPAAMRLTQTIFDESRKPLWKLNLRVRDKISIFYALIALAIGIMTIVAWTSQSSEDQIVSSERTPGIVAANPNAAMTPRPGPALEFRAAPSPKKTVP